MTVRKFRLFGVALPILALALGTSAFAQEHKKAEAKPEAKQEAKKEEPKKAEEPKKNGKDILETAVGGGLKTFSELVIQANLVDELKKPGPFTVFAPTDEAFGKMGKDLDELKKPENKAKLADFLKGHIVAKKLDLKKDKDAKPLAGADLKFAEKDGKTTVNGANVTKALDASNGQIQVIDAALKAEAKKEEPKKEEPKKEEKKAEAKPAEMKKEEPKKEEPKKAEPKKEEPKKEEPKKAEPKKEEPKKEEPKKAEPKKEEPKKEEPKKAEPKKEEPKKEEPKKAEPKKDEPKKEEPKH